MNTHTLTSPLSVRECASRLDAGIDRDDACNLFGLLGTRSVIGQVEADTFSLRTRPWGKRTFHVELTGELTSTHGVTTIEMQTRMSPDLPRFFPLLVMIPILAATWYQEGALHGVVVSTFSALTVWLSIRVGEWFAWGHESELVHYVTVQVAPPAGWVRPERPVREASAFGECAPILAPQGHARRAMTQTQGGTAPANETAPEQPVAGEAESTAACLACREELDANATRCEECGTGVHARCRSARCGMCGAPLPIRQARRAPLTSLAR